MTPLQERFLQTYLVGGEIVYGLKTKESEPPENGKAQSVLLPTHAPHTRYYFAKKKQEQIVIEFAKRLSNGWTTQGAFGKKSISKINQCERIINYYCNK